MDTDGNIRCLSGISHTLLTAVDEPAADSGVAGLTVLFIIFVVLGAYFGGAESGFSAMNKIRIKAKADDGDKHAKDAVAVSNNFERALTTLLIGNNITHIAAASIATVIATRLFGSSDKVTLICTVVTTLIVFLFSEMIPKSFANDRSETTSLLCAGSLRILMKVLAPLAAFFTLISSAFTNLLSHFFKHEEEPSITEEELYDIIETVEEEGVFDEEQTDLIRSALDFSATRAADVMTMRSDICAIDISWSNERIIEEINHSAHSRLPVYDGDLDNIVGILQIRTFAREYLKNPEAKVRSLILPAFTVSPDALINDLLSEMRQHKFYLAVVSDSDGKTLGLVSIEDFLEELVGEIWDEDDVVDRDFIKLGGNRFMVNTHLTLFDVCGRLGIANPEHYDKPIISLLVEHFGRVPDEGDSFTLGPMEFIVDTVENNRVNTVVVHLLTEE